MIEMRLLDAFDQNCREVKANKIAASDSLTSTKNCCVTPTIMKLVHRFLIIPFNPIFFPLSIPVSHSSEKLTAFQLVANERERNRVRAACFMAAFAGARP